MTEFPSLHCGTAAQRRGWRYPLTRLSVRGEVVATVQCLTYCKIDLSSIFSFFNFVGNPTTSVQRHTELYRGKIHLIDQFFLTFVGKLRACFQQ